MQNEIRRCIEKQEQLGLDVLVHGEAERNDMVEYFGQQLGGFCFTQNGWVQSYGTHAVYGLMETKLPWDFTLNYGVRQTWVRSTMNTARGDKTTTSQMMGPPTTTYSNPSAGGEGSSWESQPVFNLSLMWQGIDDMTLRAGFSQGFRVPNLQEKYIISSMGGGTIEPNASLKPEHSNNWEVGARYAAHGLALDASLFYTVATDYIATEQTGNNIYRYRNVSSAKTHGMELSGSYDLPFGFTPYVSATWMKRQYDNGDYTTWKTGVPEWTGRAGVRSLHSVNDDVDIIGDVYARFASQTQTESGSSRIEYKNDAWTTANAMLGVKFGKEKQYMVVGEVLNIFNQKYSLEPNAAIYEPGVHANIKVSVEF